MTSVGAKWWGFMDVWFRWERLWKIWRKTAIVGLKNILKLNCFRWSFTFQTLPEGMDWFGGECSLSATLYEEFEEFDVIPKKMYMRSSMKRGSRKREVSGRLESMESIAKSFEENERLCFKNWVSSEQGSNEAPERDRMCICKGWCVNEFRWEIREEY